MRLNRYIALSTKYSRRAADELIRAGYVRINGRTIFDLGVKVTSGLDAVTLHGRAIAPRTHVYYALNKPVGYTSTTLDPFARQKVIDLVPRHHKVHIVGRLDKNSQGLMILTNDGEFTNLLTHPRYHVEKEYYVEGYPTDDEWDASRLREMAQGMSIDDYDIKPAQVHSWRFLKGKVSFYIILKEGRKRQIRRMAENIDLRVTKLQRVRMGNLKLSNLPIGKYRKITPDEVM